MYDDSPEEVQDEDYATVKAYNKRFGFIDEGIEGGGVGMIPIGIHKCTSEEMGISGDASKSKFYPFSATSRHDAEVYSQKMYCLDNDIEIFGSYTSDAASHLVLRLELCNPEERTTCKSREDTLKWL